MTFGIPVSDVWYSCTMNTGNVPSHTFNWRDLWYNSQWAPADRSVPEPLRVRAVYPAFWSHQERKITLDERGFLICPECGDQYAEGGEDKAVNVFPDRDHYEPGNPAGTRGGYTVARCICGNCGACLALVISQHKGGLSVTLFSYSPPLPDISDCDRMIASCPGTREKLACHRCSGKMVSDVTFPARAECTRCGAALCDNCAWTSWQALVSEIENDIVNRER